MNQDYYTIKEIAEHYDVTTVAVHQWIKRKNIPFKIEKVIKVRPRIIVRLEDVEKALNNV